MGVSTCFSSDTCCGTGGHSGLYLFSNCSSTVCLKDFGLQVLFLAFSFCANKSAIKLGAAGMSSQRVHWATLHAWKHWGMGLGASAACPWKCWRGKLVCADSAASCWKHRGKAVCRDSSFRLWEHWGRELTGSIIFGPWKHKGEGLISVSHVGSCRRRGMVPCDGMCRLSTFLHIELSLLDFSCLHCLTLRPVSRLRLKEMEWRQWTDAHKKSLNSFHLSNI